jgi:hypothetical protein
MGREGMDNIQIDGKPKIYDPCDMNELLSISLNQNGLVEVKIE